MRIVALTVLAVLLSSSGSAAQEDLVSKWEINVGAILTGVDTKVQADANEVDLGTRIDLEDSVGFDENESLVKVSVARRFGRRHVLRFDASELSRSGGRQISTEFRFENIVFPIEATISGEFDSRIIDLRYVYMPVLKEKTAVFVTGGVGQWDFDLDLAATVQPLRRPLEAGIGISEIVPMFGAGVRQQITPKFRFDARLLALVFDLGDTSGTILEFDPGFRYWFHKNVGIAVALQFFDVNVEFDDPRKLLGEVDYNLTGIQFFIPIRFD
jgi:hypothetical protein